MSTRLALLALLLIGPAALRAADPPAAPADPPLPLPLCTTRPSPGGPYFVGGSRCGFGWIYEDGSTIGACWRHLAGPVAILCRRPVRETEFFRQSVVVGTRAGVVYEWYLGHRVAFRLDLGGAASLACAGLDWYPLEGLNLSAGYDLTAGWVWGWALAF
jgi:hypothetical protein